MKPHVFIAGILLCACGPDVTPYRFVVEDDTVLCRPGRVGAGFHAARAEKLRARFPAGEYELPATHAPEEESLDAMPHSQPHEWRLPVSLEFESETIEDAPFGNGTLYVEMNEGLSDSRERAFLFAKQPVVGLDGRTGSFNLEQVEEDAGGREFVIGPNYNPETLGVALWWDEPPFAFLASCDFDFLFEGLRYVWRVEHELGVIDLELAGGYWRWPGGPPIVFDRAAGEHDGVHFEQEDYFKLIHYPADLNGVWNSFAVLFDEPIGSACGISFTNLGPDDLEVHRSASLLDCDLEEVAPIEVLEATLLEPQWPE
jgi:hypothetical protein